MIILPCSPSSGSHFKKKKTILYAPLAQLVEQLTLNLALGVIFVLITLVVLIACIISSLANIPQAVCEGPGFESGTLASPKSYAPIYSSIAQSVERMTVNHDVTGSASRLSRRIVVMRHRQVCSCNFLLS